MTSRSTLLLEVLLPRDIASEHRQHTPPGDRPCKYAPHRPRSVRYCEQYTLKTRWRGGRPQRRGAVTHERQRDSDGLAAIPGAVAALVAQAQRREKSTGGLSSFGKQLLANERQTFRVGAQSGGAIRPPMQQNAHSWHSASRKKIPSSSCLAAQRPMLPRDMPARLIGAPARAVLEHQPVSGIQFPWKVKGTRTGSSMTAWGSPSKSRALRITTELRSAFMS